MLDEVQQVAKDYLSRRITLADVASWLNARLTAWVDMPDEDPAAGLFGFMQIRIWENDNGHLDEEVIREELGAFLRDEGMLDTAPSRRISG